MQHHLQNYSGGSPQFFVRGQSNGESIDNLRQGGWGGLRIILKRGAALITNLLINKKITVVKPFDRTNFNP